MVTSIVGALLTFFGVISGTCVLTETSRSVKYRTGSGSSKYRKDGIRVGGSQCYTT